MDGDGDRGGDRGGDEADEGRARLDRRRFLGAAAAGAAGLALGAAGCDSPVEEAEPP
ncbi:twin-arginine translocation signal domain-containing protein, partial [Streptomyces sp. NPDC055039]